MHLRTRRAPDGRVVITDLFLHGAELTAETLRDIPWSRIEALLNGPTAPEPGTESDDALTFVELREHAADVARKRRRSPRRGRPRLQRPDGTDPDGFYRQVAEAYTEYASELRAPALAIAEEVGGDLPVPTARRWINEARRRGHLPPGRRGKVG